MTIVAGFFDFDGTVYSVEYFETLFLIVHEFGAEIKEYTKQALDEDQRDAKRLVARILKRVKSMAPISSDDRFILRSSLFERYAREHDLPNETRVHQRAIQDAILEEYAPLLNKLSKEIRKTILLKANMRIIDELCAEVEKYNSPRLPLYFSTSRQSHGLDNTGRKNNKSGSVFEDMQILVDEFNQRLTKPGEEKKCVVMNLLLTDIYNDLEIGETYRRIMEAAAALESGADASHIKHPSYLYFDHTKLLLVRTQAHHLGEAFPGHELKIHFYEDSRAIIAAFSSALSNHLFLLSTDMRLYVHDVVTGEKLCMVGQGYHDKNYREHVWKILALSGIEKGSAERTFDLARQPHVLKAFVDHLRQTSDAANKVMPSLGNNAVTTFGSLPRGATVKHESAAPTLDTQSLSAPNI